MKSELIIKAKDILLDLSFYWCGDKDSKDIGVIIVEEWEENLMSLLENIVLLELGAGQEQISIDCSFCSLIFKQDSLEKLHLTEGMEGKSLCLLLLKVNGSTQLMFELEDPIM